MRDLTAEELNIAPDWATHYAIDFEDGDVIYESDEWCWWAGLDSRLKNCWLSECAKPIPQKQPDFNLDNYEFIDENVASLTCDKNVVSLFCYGDMDEYPEFTLQKSDVIALAKHFKITQEDLK